MNNVVHKPRHCAVLSMSFIDRARQFGVSEPEYLVLAVVHYHTPMSVHDMPRWALKEFEDYQLLYSVLDLELAVEGCIEKGWLRVLPGKVVGRRPPWYSTFSKYHELSPGKLDFTREGHELAEQIWREGQVGHGLRGR